MACKRNIYLFLLLSVTFSLTDGRLLSGPRDAVSKVNESAYFNCSTTDDPEDMYWIHGDKYVYDDRKILKPYNLRFETEIIGKSCNLVIRSVQTSDEGEYTCSEGGLKEKRPAHLIVLDSDPSFRSSIKLAGVTGQNNCNEVELTCSVTFHGKTPAMEWKKVGDNKTITDGLCNVLSGNSYNETLKLLEDVHVSQYNSSYVCQITTHLPYKFNSEIINVHVLFEDTRKRFQYLRTSAIENTRKELQEVGRRAAEKIRKRLRDLGSNAVGDNLNPVAADETTQSSASLYTSAVVGSSQSCPSLGAITFEETEQILRDLRVVVVEETRQLLQDLIDVAINLSQNIGKFTHEETRQTSPSLEQSTAEETEKTSVSHGPRTTEETRETSVSRGPSTTEDTRETSVSHGPSTTEDTRETSVSHGQRTTNETQEILASYVPGTAEETQQTTVFHGTSTTKNTRNTSASHDLHVSRTKKTQTTASLDSSTTDKTTQSSQSIRPSTIEETTQSSLYLGPSSSVEIQPSALTLKTFPVDETLQPKPSRNMMSFRATGTSVDLKVSPVKRNPQSSSSLGIKVLAINESFDPVDMTTFYVDVTLMESSSTTPVSVQGTLLLSTSLFTKYFTDNETPKQSLSSDIGDTRDQESKDLEEPVKGSSGTVAALATILGLLICCMPAAVVVTLLHFKREKKRKDEAVAEVESYLRSLDLSEEDVNRATDILKESVGNAKPLKSSVAHQR